MKTIADKINPLCAAIKKRWHGTNYAAIVVRVITYPMAGLFTLAAATKVLKYATYSSYFTTSKLVSAFWGPYVAIVLIMAELLISFLLLWPKTRKAGLLAALGMLPFYHYYIHYVLHNAPFTPCSCLGAAPIGWEAHYTLNAIVLLAGLLSLWLHQHTKTLGTQK